MTSATEPKTIDLGGNCIQREAEAGEAITPGMLVEIDSAGELIAHGTAAQECQPAFALEFAMTGRSITDAYADGDQVIYGIFADGSEVYAIIADGEDIAVGDKLASDGAGALAEAATTDFVVAEAREAVVTSGAVGRCRVEIAVGRGV